MKKRQSRFDKMREEKKEHPFLYADKNKVSGKTDQTSKSDYSSIAKVLKIMLSEKK